MTLARRLARRESGVGSPALLLHCSAGSGALWRSLQDRLSADYRVIAPDLPGYGDSVDCRGPARAGLAQDAAWLDEIFEDCGEPVHLVGHSYGASLALTLARARPERIRSLTLIEPVLFHLLAAGAPAERALLREVIGLSSTMASRLGAGDPWSAMAGFVDYWNGAGAWGRLEADRREALARQAGQVLLNFAAGYSETWPLADCARIAVPSLMIMGTASPAPARRITELIAQAIPGARLVLIPGAGHMAPVTHAASLDPLIGHHLAEVGRARTTPRAA